MGGKLGRLASLAAAVIGFTLAGVCQSQGFDDIRSDQLAKLQDYVLDAISPSGLVRDSLVLDPANASFHPATPDAAGFALVSLAAFDHLGTLADADQRVLDILLAYTGNRPGVTPERSPDGHYIHFMDISTGADSPGWDDSYSPIGSARIVAGAQMARNHFAGTDSPLAVQIDSLTRELTDSIDFNAAIHPSLDGRIYLDMTSSGGGSGAATSPWNEYQLVASLALRQENNDRALAVKHLWLNPENAPTKSFGGNATLTDDPNRYAPAFWVQQAQFFNGDFRNNADFQDYLESQRKADELYGRAILQQSPLYGLTAGVSPGGYHADRIQDHPGTVFSPEAVAAWGDMESLLEFYADQIPSTNTRYRYGMIRRSVDQPSWIPSDAGLVDHLFLLFGLVESLDADFFESRVFAPLLPGDYNFDGVVDAADYTVWRDAGSGLNSFAADGDLDGDVDHFDYLVWKSNFGRTNILPTGLQSATIPEPTSLWLCLLLAAAHGVIRDYRRTVGARTYKAYRPAMVRSERQSPNPSSTYFSAP